MARKSRGREEVRGDHGEHAVIETGRCRYSCKRGEAENMVI